MENLIQNTNDKIFYNYLEFRNTKISFWDGKFSNYEDGDITKDVILLSYRQNRNGEYNKHFYILEDQIFIIEKFDNQIDDEILKNEFVNISIEYLADDEKQNKKEFNQIFKCFTLKERKKIKTFLKNYITTKKYLNKTKGQL